MIKIYFLCQHNCTPERFHKVNSLENVSLRNSFKKLERKLFSISLLGIYARIQFLLQTSTFDYAPRKYSDPRSQKETLFIFWIIPTTQKSYLEKVMWRKRKQYKEILSQKTNKNISHSQKSEKLYPIRILMSRISVELSFHCFCFLGQGVFVCLFIECNWRCLCSFTRL